MFAAAIGTVGDFSGFCTRQPTVCETAHGLLYKLEAKAKYSLHLLYQWVESPEQPRPALSTEAKLNDPITTSTIAAGRCARRAMPCSPPISGRNGGRRSGREPAEPVLA